MNKKFINVVFKNGRTAVWKPDEWDDYAYDGAAFIIKKNGVLVGIYSMHSIIFTKRNKFFNNV